jgi:hypothetical protein
MYRHTALIATLVSLATVPGPPAKAQTNLATFALARAGALTISAPGPTSLGSAPPSGQITTHLGTVLVDDTRVPGAGVWTATVSSTDFTRTTGPVVTISRSRMSYWSGPVTANSGGGNNVPGQPTASAAQDLSVPRTAFSQTRTNRIQTASWAPTLILSIPNAATAGNYSGTITHSVT